MLTLSNLILIGFKGSGKTTLGRSLASQLKMPFIDTDDLFEETPASLYNRIGPDLFYAHEKKLIYPLKNLQRHVIATGGGTPLLNGDFLRHLGTVIHLQTPRQTIEERIGNHPFFEQYHMRLAIYEKIAHYTVTTTGQLWHVAYSLKLA